MFALKFGGDWGAANTFRGLSEEEVKSGREVDMEERKGETRQSVQWGKVM
jgi:hypothetical protein